MSYYEVTPEKRYINSHDYRRMAAYYKRLSKAVGAENEEAVIPARVLKGDGRKKLEGAEIRRIKYTMSLKSKQAICDEMRDVNDWLQNNTHLAPKKSA